MSGLKNYEENKKKITISHSGYFIFNLDILEKMNRNLLSLKYEMRSLHEKVDKIDEIIRNNTMNNSVELNKDASMSDLCISLNSDFPLEDENGLQTFENKLLDNSYRVQLVSCYIFLILYIFL